MKNKIFNMIWFDDWNNYVHNITIDWDILQQYNYDKLVTSFCCIYVVCFFFLCLSLLSMCVCVYIKGYGEENNAFKLGNNRILYKIHPLGFIINIFLIQFRWRTNIAYIRDILVRKVKICPC